MFFFLSVQPEQAHDAMYDVVMLHNVAFQHFAIDELLLFSQIIKL